MAVPTDTEILNALKTALYEIAVNGAASYTANGRTWTGLDLDKLNTAIAIYEARVARAAGSRMLAPITFRSPR